MKRGMIWDGEVPDRYLEFVSQKLRALLYRRENLVVEPCLAYVAESGQVEFLKWVAPSGVSFRMRVRREQENA